MFTITATHLSLGDVFPEADPGQNALHDVDETALFKALEALARSGEPDAELIVSRAGRALRIEYQSEGMLRYVSPCSPKNARAFSVV